MSFMKASIRYLVIGVALVLTCATFSSAAQNSDTSPTALVRIELNGSMLTLATRDAPLHEVMQAIADLAGFRTILVGDFFESPLVSVDFDNIPVEEAIERLVSDKNRIIIYQPAQDKSRQPVISQLWLLQSGDAAGVFGSGNDEGIALAREKDVDGYKLARITARLQQDRDATVRARAAIALGAFQDDRAVLALEAGLSDADSSVRSQVISALGRIGSEQAIIALGNILLRDSAATSDRVKAARTLWQHDSELARDYLRAGTNDRDQQIRSASSKPMSSRTGQGSDFTRTHTLRKE